MAARRVTQRSTAPSRTVSSADAGSPGRGLLAQASLLLAGWSSARLEHPAGDRAAADLAASGWGPRRLGRLWLPVVLACGIAAALGFLGTDLSSAVQGDRAAALAAGGLLAMLTNSLIPFSFERGGPAAGAATALGFCVSVLNL